jgi:hypothetical protein
VLLSRKTVILCTIGNDSMRVDTILKLGTWMLQNISLDRKGRFISYQTPESQKEGSGEEDYLYVTYVADLETGQQKEIFRDLLVRY